MLWRGCLGEAAFLEFFAAATRAKVIASDHRRGLRVFGLDVKHKLLDGLARLMERCKLLQVRAAVGEKPLQASAEIVQPRFAVRSRQETVLGTPAIAHGEDLALAALAG